MGKSIFFQPRHGMLGLIIHLSERKVRRQLRKVVLVNPPLREKGKGANYLARRTGVLWPRSAVAATRRRCRRGADASSAERK